MSWSHGQFTGQPILRMTSITVRTGSATIDKSMVATVWWRYRCAQPVGTRRPAGCAHERGTPTESDLPLGGLPGLRRVRLRALRNRCGRQLPAPGDLASTTPPWAFTAAVTTIGIVLPTGHWNDMAPRRWCIVRASVARGLHPKTGCTSSQLEANRLLIDQTMRLRRCEHA